MEQLFHNENEMNNSNKLSTLDTNKKGNLFYNNGHYFSFGKDNSLSNKLTPNTSCFNFKENLKKSADNIKFNSSCNNFLNKKRKLMTSEELELEQIERERKEVKKMIKKNMALYYRTKSGTTTIVSKIKDNIYNNNLNKNILNNYLNNKINNVNMPLGSMNKNNSYVMNFMKGKRTNKINDFINSKSDSMDKIEIKDNPLKDKIVEIINTDLNNNKNNNFSTNKEIDINKEKKDKIIELNEDNEKEEEDINKDEEKKIEISNNEKEEVSQLTTKTPNKENLYLTKIKKLGSMSKLSLCNKIQKYTEICEEVLKEQENREGNKEEKGKKVEEKKIKKGKKFEKVEKNKRKEKSKKKNKKSCSKK